MRLLGEKTGRQRFLQYLGQAPFFPLISLKKKISMLAFTFFPLFWEGLELMNFEILILYRM